MKKENQLSVSQFARQAEISTNHVYRLGLTGKIEIQLIAGFKVIDKVKYPPANFKKQTKN